jgi:hypothetical protein
MVMNEELIGLEIVWHIFFESSDRELYKKAMDLLMQVI